MKAKIHPEYVDAVFTCACGSALHYDTADTPADERLLCATLSGECASCRRPIRLEGGFQYVPAHG